MSLNDMTWADARQLIFYYYMQNDNNIDLKCIKMIGHILLKLGRQIFNTLRWIMNLKGVILTLYNAIEN